MHVGPSAPTPVSIAPAHCPPAPVCVPSLFRAHRSAQLACRGAWLAGPAEKRKNVNFLASTHDSLPKYLHVKQFLGTLKIWRQLPRPFPSYK